MKRSTVTLLEQGKRGREAAVILSKTSTARKNQALIHIADFILDHKDEVLDANARDINSGNGVNDAFMDRLVITPERLSKMAEDVRNIAKLDDPVGEVYDMNTRPNGLRIGKKRVPLGVIGSIYESRPNVTLDISSLCLKSGNACILRGGSEAINSNSVLTKLVRQAIGEVGLPEDAVQLIEHTDRKFVRSMLKMHKYIDLMIPRGSADFIDFVSKHATMPIVAGGVGVCRTFIDKAANFDNAIAIAYNAKVQRPTVCNALDTLLVHRDIAAQFLPAMARKWAEVGVEMRCDRRSLSILSPIEGLNLKPSIEADWNMEFLSLTAAVKVVDSADEAIEHIRNYYSGHSEAIVTEDESLAMKFLDEVDAAAVFVNASTYFHDGSEFGLGAEIGISTQKFHARGPMALKEITSYKWIVLGKGQIRI